MSEYKSDPANYRKLSEPFRDADAANKALDGFYSAIDAVRNEFHIPDVVTIIRANVVGDSGEYSAITISQLGDEWQHEIMLAYALGKIQTDRQERIGKLLHRAAFMQGGTRK
jgi:kynureninase